MAEKGVKEGSHGQSTRLLRTRALDIHEVRVWRLHDTLELVSAGLSSGAGVEEIDGESLWRVADGSVPDSEKSYFRA